MYSSNLFISIFYEYIESILITMSNTVEDTVGTFWIDKHIEMWICGGGPWLGTPKMIRAVVLFRFLLLFLCIDRSHALCFQ